MFIRDLTHTTALVVQVLFFVTPIFYPIDAIPTPFRSVIEYNPLAGVVEALRAVIFTGQLTSWVPLLVSGTLGFAFMLVGYAWFMKTRRAFGDVI